MDLKKEKQKKVPRDSLETSLGELATSSERWLGNGGGDDSTHRDNRQHKQRNAANSLLNPLAHVLGAFLNPILRA